MCSVVKLVGHAFGIFHLASVYLVPPTYIWEQESWSVLSVICSVKETTKQARVKIGNMQLLDSSIHYKYNS